MASSSSLSKTQSSNPPSFLSLPEDILITIICTTTPLDTLSLSKTCPLLWRLATQRVVWLRLYDSYILKDGLADTLGRSRSTTPLTCDIDQAVQIVTRSLIQETIGSYTLAQRWRTLNQNVSDLRNRSQTTSGLQAGLYSPHSHLTFVPRSRPSFTPLQSTHIVPTLSTDLTSNPTFIKFIDIGDFKYSGRLVLTVSRVIWLVVQVWDVGAGARREGVRGRKNTGKGKRKERSMQREEAGNVHIPMDGEGLSGPEDDDVVAKNCLCQWSARGASFSGIVVNQEGDQDGTVAIGLLHDGRHYIQILKLTPPLSSESTSSSTWSLQPVFTLSNIGMDMYPVSLIGHYLCVANARDKTEIIHWKKNLRGVLRETEDDVLGGGGLQYNKCSQILLIPDTKSILVIRARSIHLFRWPKFYPIIVSSPTGHHNRNTNNFGFTAGSFNSSLASTGPTDQTFTSSMLTTWTPTTHYSALIPSSLISSLAPTLSSSPSQLTGNTTQPPTPLQPSPQPEIERSIASYSFGWVDCITATIARTPISNQTYLSGKTTPQRIHVFFRGTLDDPWANDDTKLEVWVIEGNPEWDGRSLGDDDGEYERNHPETTHLASNTIAAPSFSLPTSEIQYPSPYLFPPTPLPSLSIPTPRGPLLCPTLILGRNMTAVWIEPKERVGRVGGMVVDYEGMGGGLGVTRTMENMADASTNVNVSLSGGTRVFGLSDDIGPRPHRGTNRGIGGGEGSSSSTSATQDGVFERRREQERQRKSEKVMVVALPGPFYGYRNEGGLDGVDGSLASTLLDNIHDTSFDSVPKVIPTPRPLQLIHNPSSSNWSAIDYDEDRGRVVVASSVRGFVVVDL